MTFEESLDQLNQTSPLRITVSGDIGAGKSTFAKRLAETLNIPRIYIGQFMREEAAKRGITLEEFGKLLEQDDAIDREMDAHQQEVARQTPRGVFEGRTAWHFVENPDVKVFIAVSEEQAAKRIFSDKNALRDKYATETEVLEGNKRRKQSEITRYQTYYGIDVYDQSNFDIIIDTSEKTLEEVFQDGILQIAAFLHKNKSNTLDGKA